MAFKPGQSGNPTGRPKLPEEVRLLQEATSIQVKKDLCECYNTHIETLRALSRRQDVSAGLAMIASCIVAAADNGDAKLMEVFLNRLIGKVPQPVELGSPDENGFKIVVEDYTKK